MAYEQTQQMGESQQPFQSSDNEMPTEVMGPGGDSEYTSPQPVAPQKTQQPMGGYQPAPAPAAKTEIMYKPPSVMAWLVIASGHRTGTLRRLSPDVTTVGRDAHNDIIIDDPKASRQHAKVRLEKGDNDQEQFFIHDLATPNGIMVNGEKIIKQALYDGDRLKIGETVLVFKQLDGPQRATEEAPEQEAASEPEGE